MEHEPQDHRIIRIISPVIATIAGLVGVGPYEHAHAQSPDVLYASSEAPFDGAARVKVPGDQGDLAIVNLTAVDAETPGYATVIGGDSNGITARSSVNFSPGTISPNTASGEIGHDGTIVVKNSMHGLVNFIVDPLLTVDNDSFSAADNRLFDTRDRGYPMAPGEIICTPSFGTQGDAELINLTVTGSNGPGYVVAFPGGSPVPEASSNNFLLGETAPNQTIVTVGPNANQEICVYNSETSSVHVIVDDNGAIHESSWKPTPNNSPLRVVDTRIGLGGTRMQPGGKIWIEYGTPGDVIAMNITPVGASGPGFGKAYGGYQSSPNTSNVNFNANTIDANMAFGVVGENGFVIFEISEHSQTDVIVDILGAIDKSAVKNATAFRGLDTRNWNSKVNPSRDPGLVEVGFNPNNIMPPNANMNLDLIHSRVQYGSHPSQYYDIYESRDHKDRVITNGAPLFYAHGGGWEGGDNTLSTGFDDLARFITAEDGYRLFSISYRKSGEAPWPAQNNDVELAIQHAIDHAGQFNIDPKKSILMGASSGGNSMINAGLSNRLTVQPRGIVALGAPVNPAGMAINPLPGTNPYPALNKLVGVSPTAPPALAQYAQLNTAVGLSTRNDPPLFLAMDPNDPIVQLAPQLPPIYALSQQGRVVLNYTSGFGHQTGNATDLPALRKFLSGK